MIKDLNFVEIYSVLDKIKKDTFNIRSIRFSLISRYDEFDLLAEIILKVRNNEYKHLIHLMDHRDLFSLIERDKCKKCLTKNDILKVISALSSDNYMWVASKNYYKKRNYVGEKVVYVREIEV
jgi:hypothetical protein